MYSSPAQIPADKKHAYGPSGLTNQSWCHVQEYHWIVVGERTCRLPGMQQDADSLMKRLGAGAMLLAQACSTCHRPKVLMSVQAQVFFGKIKTDF